MSRQAITSIKLPYAISQNLIFSLEENLLQPSARFKQTETAALLIWLVNPNFSSLGKGPDNL